MIGIMELVDELTYCNYRHNRTISPHISVERWTKSYGPETAAMEQRYQRERHQAQDYFASEMNCQIFDNWVLNVPKPYDGD